MSLKFDVPCKYHHINGYCRYGDQCRFSHTPPVSSQVTDLVRMVDASFKDLYRDVQFLKREMVEIKRLLRRDPPQQPPPPPPPPPPSLSRIESLLKKQSEFLKAQFAQGFFRSTMDRLASQSKRLQRQTTETHQQIQQQIKQLEQEVQNLSLLQPVAAATMSPSPSPSSSFAPSTSSLSSSDLDALLVPDFPGADRQAFAGRVLEMKELELERKEEQEPKKTKKKKKKKKKKTSTTSTTSTTNRKKAFKKAIART